MTTSNKITGQKPQTIVLTREVVTPLPEVGDKLRLRADERVLHLRRLRIAQSRPLAILENYLPLCRVDLAGVDLGSVGLYQAMRAAGVRMRVANQLIGAREGTLDPMRIAGRAGLRAPVDHGADHP